MIPKSPPTRFWSGYLFLGLFKSEAAHQIINFRKGARYVANANRRCVVIPFPRNVSNQSFIEAHRKSTTANELNSGRLIRGMEMLWNHPRTYGAFVVQRLVSITLAITLGSLFDWLLN